MMGTVMVFAAVGLVDSMDFSFSDYFGSNHYDLRLLVSQPVSARSLERRAEKAEGVTSAQAALFGLVTAQSATKTFDTLAFVLDETDPYIVTDHAGGRARLFERGGRLDRSQPGAGA